MQPKPVIPAEHAINWYVGNYIMDTDNALREDDDLMQKARQEIESLKQELKGERMTHQQLLDLLKERGIHVKYYHYQKYEPPYCLVCDKLGVPRRGL